MLTKKTLYRTKLTFLKTALALGMTATLSGCDDSPAGPVQANLNSGVDYLLIATTDNSTGSLSLLNLEDSSMQVDIGEAHSDAVVTAIDNVPYVINRLGADNITRLDPNNSLAVVYEESVGTGTNPHGLASINNSTGVVSLYSGDELPLIDLATGSAQDTISITQFADSDGSAEADELIAVNGSIYMTIQNLVSFSPVQNGRILEVDPVNLTATQVAELPYENPFSAIRHFQNSDGDHLLYLACVGSFGAADGGVAVYNATTGQLESPALTEEDADGSDILDTVIYSETLGFVILYSSSSFGTSLWTYNPSTGELGQNVIADDDFFNVSGLLLHEDKLYVARGSSENSGIRIFDVQTLEEETAAPISTGLPPRAMAVFTVLD